MNTSAGKVVSRESTLGSRALPQKQFQTPAPGEYDIDKLDKSKLQAGGCIRGYTFGHPNVNHRSSRTPGKFNCFVLRFQIMMFSESDRFSPDNYWNGRNSRATMFLMMIFFEKRNGKQRIFFRTCCGLYTTL